MGRPSGSKARNQPVSSALRVELERHIETGRCVYCRAPARPGNPLTREHVIPRARGGRRNDVRIIVPACARCNHHRGCGDLIPFLLARPQRISSFLDYLSTLSVESVRELDLRIFAELYTAVAILTESAAYGPDWRVELERLCSGRSLHRRRYATRRAVGAVSNRLGTRRDTESGPTCPLPAPRGDVIPLHLEEPLERMASRLLSLLALLWEISAEVVEQEIAKELSGSAVYGEPLTRGVADDGSDGIVSLDAWGRRPKRRRLRVDRRHGGQVRRRGATYARGRAA